MAHSNPFVYFLNIDADQVEANVKVNVEKVLLIANDSNDTITFTFDGASATQDDQIKLLAGEKIEDLDVPVGTLYYKSATGDNKNFRFYGLKNRK
jgi:hypothetical protein